jgi:hypothetical protein
VLELERLSMFISKVVVRCSNTVRKRDFGFVQCEVPSII